MLKKIKIKYKILKKKKKPSLKLKICKRILIINKKFKNLYKIQINKTLNQE